SPTTDGQCLAIPALWLNASFARLAPGGGIALLGGVVDDRLPLAQSAPASQIPFDYLMAGWDAASGQWLPGFPRPIEGWQLAGAPAVADVSGDGRPEVVAGSSGDVLHAVSSDGSEPPGWPKQTGGWRLALPARGEIDGDGRNEGDAVI